MCVCVYVCVLCVCARACVCERESMCTCVHVCVCVHRYAGVSVFVRVSLSYIYSFNLKRTSKIVRKFAINLFMPFLDLSYIVTGSEDCSVRLFCYSILFSI